MILEKSGVREWNVFIWFRIGTGNQLVWSWQGTFDYREFFDWPSEYKLPKKIVLHEVRWLVGC
jgi:hypothetical protein